MKTICLYFEIHQIIHLKRYRFFDIGTDHYYYDDYENERSITDIANRSYIPALNTLYDMIKENGNYFKVAFSLSGTGIEQLEMHAPQVIEKLQQLNETGCVEFLAEPYSHGLSSLANNDKHEERSRNSSASVRLWPVTRLLSTATISVHRLPLWASRVCLLRAPNMYSVGSPPIMYTTATRLLI